MGVTVNTENGHDLYINVDDKTHSEIFFDIHDAIKKSDVALYDRTVMHFVGHSLINPLDIAVVIEYYHDYNDKIKFIIQTHKPAVGYGHLVYMSKQIDTMELQFKDQYSVPDSKIKILEDLKFTKIETGEQFWEHANGHMISLAKVLQTEEDNLVKYLKSLAGIGEK